MKIEPIATYRVQLTGQFTQYDAAELLPYLADLGIDHLYTSPTLQAAPGSDSGYDVIDPGRVDKDLGGQDGHDALTHALHRHRMYRMIDIVPNHMAISRGHNPWWDSVLKHGKSSPHADWFDVDWDASEAHWPNRVLLPVLGNQFGRVLEAGELQLRHWEGQFTLHYFDHTFPVEPSSTAEILAKVAHSLQHQQLLFHAESLRRLPRPAASMDAEVEGRNNDFAAVSHLLARVCREETTVAEAIDAETQRLNQNPHELGALIEAQNYRLADWRAAAQDLGYRRFFNINNLVGLRVELPEVFDAVHVLPLQWLRDGSVQALRVDHPDGLRDPAEYMQRLRKAVPDNWIVVEKILARGEKLPRDWPVEGTTGYDFCNVVQGLFVDPAGEKKLTQCYASFVGRDTSYADELRESKRCVLKELLGSEMWRLTSLFGNICERHWRHRDFTRDVYARAIIEVAIGFDVYRTYVRPGTTVSPEDRARIEHAVAAAGEVEPPLDAELLQFMQQLLLLEVDGTLEEEFAMRFQQLTGPAMAKGLEDTAFYRYLRFCPLNEVGGSPANWCTTIPAFHEWCAEALRERPYSMLATSTHDSKRGEDMRARLLVISEVPELWINTVQRWYAQNSPQRGPRLDANTEYLLYQTLVGAWPLDEDCMQGFMRKAVREAKVCTEWTRVDEEYERQLHQFVNSVMQDKGFLDEVGSFVTVLQARGRTNSLAQTLIKLTAPGIPDIYQGCELWFHNLVDPDNRRPVNFELRKGLFAELPGMANDQVMRHMEMGLPKLWLIRETLALRRAHPAWFGAQATYDPVWPEGKYKNHVVAFMRNDACITVVPRLLTGVSGQGFHHHWQDTRIPLPPGTWRNHFDQAHTFSDHAHLTQLLQTVPVALLVKES